MPRTDPAIRAAIHEEYVKGPERPTTASLAEKYKVSKRTIDGWVSNGKWRNQRSEHLQLVAKKVEEKVARMVEDKADEDADYRIKALEELRWSLRLAKNLSIGLAQGLVPEEGMSKAEIEAIMLQWEQLPMLERAGLLDRVNKTRVEILKAVELLEGRPTGRAEILSSPAVMELRQAFIVAFKDEPDAARLMGKVKGILGDGRDGNGA